jgi:hypothetical protein
VQAELRKKRLKEAMSERGAGFLGAADVSRNLQREAGFGGLGQAEDRQMTAAEVQAQAAEMNLRSAQMMASARPQPAVAVA